MVTQKDINDAVRTLRNTIDEKWELLLDATNSEMEAERECKEAYNAATLLHKWASIGISLSPPEVTNDNYSRKV